MLILGATSVGLHPLASLGTPISGCRRQAFACPPQGVLDEPTVDFHVCRCLPNRLDAFTSGLLTQPSFSGARFSSLTSLLTQRRGEQTGFQKIHVSRNQHAIHRRCPQLSTTQNPKDKIPMHQPLVCSAPESVLHEIGCREFLSLANFAFTKA